ncbi:MAG: hypothetical protein JJU27_18980 [Gammaproteobacteria bacterium]|nr:hypothetical protein [Gammaproteobacteria bacterium]
MISAACAVSDRIDALGREYADCLSMPPTSSGCRSIGWPQQRFWCHGLDLRLAAGMFLRHYREV